MANKNADAIRVVRLEERIRTLNALLDYPCKCEKSRLPEFFRHIREMKWEAEVEIDKLKSDDKKPV